MNETFLIKFLKITAISPYRNLGLTFNFCRFLTVFYNNMQFLV